MQLDVTTSHACLGWAGIDFANLAMQMFAAPIRAPKQLMSGIPCLQLDTAFGQWKGGHMCVCHCRDTQVARPSSRIIALNSP